MKIHSRKMSVNKEDVNFEELARMTEDFVRTWRSVCVEAYVGTCRDAELINS